MSWDDLDRKPGNAAQKAEHDRINRLFADVFGTPQGLEVLALLRAVTIERTVGADRSDRALVYLEGQRHLVHVIETRTAAGRQQHRTELRKDLPAVFRRMDDEGA